MFINPQQKVLPFLVDDPVYLVSLERESIAREMIERVGLGLEEEIARIIWDEYIFPTVENRIEQEIAAAVWEKSIGPIVESRIETLVREQIAGQIDEATEPLRDMLTSVMDTVTNHLNYHRQDYDQADWWKHGTDPLDFDIDEEEPF